MAVLLFIIGIIFGSFFLVVGTRLPKGEDAFFSRSKCDYCNHKLKWYNLIPIFSYLFQLGRCSYCNKKINLEYIIVELITGILFVLCYIYFPIGYNFYVSLIICSLLMIIFISDFKYMIILDSPLVISSILIIILKIIYRGFNETLISVISGIALFFVMLLIFDIGKLIFKKETLGGGDIKLAFVMGLTLNFYLGLVAIVLSTFLALPYAIASLEIKKSNAFPYGPFLCGALFLVFFHYDKFINLLNFLF